MIWIWVTALAFGFGALCGISFLVWLDRQEPTNTASKPPKSIAESRALEHDDATDCTHNHE
jgi:hypothetical protein